MTEVSFKCLYCRYISKKYNDWRKHLLEEKHQLESRQRIKMMDLKNKKRSLVVFGLISVKKKDILKYFGDLALVTDFVFWNERPDFCIITFLMTQFCEAIIQKKDHNIRGQHLFLRSRADISEVEWFSICPFAATNIKIEVDLAESTSPEDPFNDSSDDEADDNQNEETLDVDNDNTIGSDKDENDDAQMVVQEIQDQPSKEISQSPINSKQLEKESQESMSQDQDYLEMWETAPADDSIPNIENQNNSDENITTERDDIESMTSASTAHQEENADEILEESAIETSRRTTESDERFVFDLNAQMEDLYNANLMPPDAWEVRCRVKEEVELLLKSIYPNCVLIPFGAGSTAISSGREMLSMFVDTMGNTKYGSVNSALEKDVHMELSSAMRDEVKRKIVRLLKDAVHEETVVISDIKFNSNQSRSSLMEEDEIRFKYLDVAQRVYISCRLQTANFLAVQSCRVTKFYCSLDHRVRPLLILTRQWAYDNRLVQSNSPKDIRKNDCIHPVVIQWLTICYLIKKKILPPLPILQKYSITSLMYMGTNVAFCDDPDTLKWKNEDDYETDPVTGNPSARCILELARKMFHYYGETKLQKYVVMTGLGRLIRKDILSGEKDVLHDSYLWNQTKKMHTDSTFCVQHPLKLFINMASNVNSSMKNIFQDTCLKTASRLQDLLLNSSRMCNLMALLTNHKEIIWHPYQTHHRRPTSSSVFLRQENRAEPQNVMEASAQDLSGIVVVPKNKKRKKLKNFAQNVNFTKKFRNAAKKVTEPRMKAAVEENLRAVWLKFFDDFNKIVWPLCFGIKITELPDGTDVDNETGIYGKPYRLPFKGDLQNPSKLNWVKRCPKSNKDSKGDKVFNAMLLEYSQILRRSSNASPDDIEASLSCNGNIDSKMFHFRCRIFVKANKSTNINNVTANTVMQFSEIYGSEINSERRRRLVFRMYSELWDMYSFNRLMNDRCY